MKIPDKIIGALDMLCLDNFIKWDMWLKMPVDYNRKKYEIILWEYLDTIKDTIK